MLFWMCKTAKQFPNEKQIEHVILRNFSGFPTDDGIDIIHLLKKNFVIVPILIKTSVEEPAVAS